MSNHVTTRAERLGALKMFNGYEVRGRMPQPRARKVARQANFAGVRFTRLFVVEDLGILSGGEGAWGCLCDCGKKVCVGSRGLREGTTKSCGCINSDTSGGRNKLPYGYASRNELFASYKKSAASRGHVFSLSPDEFFSLVSSNCTYCGGPPDLVRKPNKGVNGEFIYSGVDRVRNDLGYIAGNVVPCCWVCNRAKGQMTSEAFNAWLDRICAFRANRGAV